MSTEVRIVSAENLEVGDYFIHNLKVGFIFCVTSKTDENVYARSQDDRPLGVSNSSQVTCSAVNRKDAQLAMSIAVEHLDVLRSQLTCEGTSTIKPLSVTDFSDKLSEALVYTEGKAIDGSQDYPDWQATAQKLFASLVEGGYVVAKSEAQR